MEYGRGKAKERTGRRARRAWPLLAVLAVLAGCASTPPAPVEDIAIDDRAPPPRVVERVPAPSAATHRVVAGDTLYSIAFKNGLDFREIARINRIEPPYRIYVGQELALADARVEREPVASAPPPVAPPAAPSPVASSPPDANPRFRVEELPPDSSRPVASASPSPGKLLPPAPPAPDKGTPIAKPPQQSASVAPVPGAVPPAPPPAVPPPSAATVEPKTPALAPGANTAAVAAPGPSAPTLTSGGITWRWPASGKVVGTFVGGDQTRQGVDIAGNAGAPVLAAADGSVVYSGNGLLGYGELIIVKHSSAFLSAYGRNRKRLVKEGDTVKAGQPIAEMGSSGTNRDMLHFEIRRNGKPVNPLEFLPAR
ncbi:peptidoglycan DD-metalloendopeptidase family protein [Tahibacter soli]|uniref:Peptidoglycan DD-metalloendopeptidase family protein n=1 Tax=Tahibacter soli TaxID=2983605 RepID=A0A9X4BMG1_9GAMM|nr:peptidoglycan DD-metalloendopeptidase family protein [Tahibacter soli]MDC8015269.1 peptidoglycan DD-metalloendopeptidase family protein [Tahibacter soli]